MRHTLRFGGIWLCAVCCLILVWSSVAVGQMVATAVKYTSGTQFTMKQEQVQPLDVYPREGLIYLTPEAQGIICPVQKVIHISAFGDSLMSGYGLEDPQEAFPVVLQQKLRLLGYNVVVMNNAVEGETTAQGLARLPQVLAMRPDILILELGANDMLQHRSIDRMKTNLERIIANVKHHNIHLLFTGMYSLPHFGNKYVDKFDAVFPDLAAKHDLAFYPFFLEGVALKHALNQQDGHHPNGRGVEVIVDNILPYVVKLIKEVCK